MPYKSKIDAYNQGVAYRALKGQELKDKKKLYYRELRFNVIFHYSNGGLLCNCCGEMEYLFLTIDHVNNDGAAHRKSLGSRYIFSWIKRNNYPNGFQVLCFNCNMAKGYYGECPHKKGEENAEEADTPT